MTTKARRHLRGCTPDSGVVHPECWCQAGKPWYAGKQPRRAVAERVYEALARRDGAWSYWRFDPDRRDTIIRAIERAIGEAPVRTDVLPRHAQCGGILDDYGDRGRRCRRCGKVQAKRPARARGRWKG